MKNLLNFLKLLLTTFLTTAIITPPAFSGTYGSHHTTYQSYNIVIPSHINIDGYQYDSDVSGIREYFADLDEDGHGDFVDDLYPSFKRLEDKYRTANNLLWGGVGIGAIIFLGAYSFLEEKPNKIAEPNFLDNPDAYFAAVETNTRRERAADARNSQTASIGMGIALLGGLGYWALRPSNKDYKKFFRLHNRKARQRGLPLIDLRIGLNETSSGKRFASYDKEVGVSLGLRIDL